jgi:anhydro-N-acetylmuramic acid kinase
VKDFNLNDLSKLSLEDGCATLSMFTVKSICMAINSFSIIPNKILFSGGGRKNDFIITNIKKIIKESIYLIDEFNFDGDFIESQAFAYLAIRSYLKKFITFPTTTGAKKPSLGGTIFKS